MENNYFLFSKSNETITLERFHICTWEFSNNTALIEFGGEINCSELGSRNELNLFLYIPWIQNSHKIIDLYDKLKEADNSRFIFNDSVRQQIYLNCGHQKYGVIQHYDGRDDLCLVPSTAKINGLNKVIAITINRDKLIDSDNYHKENIYFRFYIEPSIYSLSTRKTGINKSTIIYDLKVNEKRNMPTSDFANGKDVVLCLIKHCFLFNIIPNSYDLTFYDTTCLKTIRVLEYESFKRYLPDERVKKDELVVIFNKKSSEESYAFFTRYTKERIGAGQFSLAILANLVCGILLYIPTYKRSFKSIIEESGFWKSLPIEVYASLAVALGIVLYFLWPKVKCIFRSRKP